MTSIENRAGETWACVLEFRWSGVVIARVDLTLDREMIPLSTEICNIESTSLSVAGLPSLGASADYSNVAVDREKRSVSFRIFQFTTSNTEKHFRKTVEFEWASPRTIPDTVSVKVTITSRFGRKSEHVIRGLNAKRPLIELIQLKPSSHFYFPRDSRIIELPLVEVTKLSPDLQKAPDTTGWNITWPAEAPYWKSEAGTRFIVSQLHKFVASDRRDRPIRIAVCPRTLYVSEALAKTLLRELEIQSRIGMDIRITTLDKIYATMRSDYCAVSSYGKSLGFILVNFHEAYEAQTAFVYLNEENIKHTREQFKAIYLSAREWAEYRVGASVIFSAKEEQYISRRVAFFYSCVRREKGSGP